MEAELKIQITIIALLFTVLTGHTQQAPLKDVPSETNAFLGSQANKGVSAGEYLIRRLEELQSALNENSQENQGRKVCFHLGLAINANETFYQYAASVSILSGAEDAAKRILYRVNRFGDSGRQCGMQHSLSLEKLREITTQNMTDVSDIIKQLKSFSASRPGEGWPTSSEIWIDDGK